MTREDLQAIAQDPKSFLLQCGKAERSIHTKARRIDHLQQISVQITTTIKAVSAYTGPGDKVGDCAAEIVDLTKEIAEEAADLACLQRRVADAIEELVPSDKQRDLLEAKYLSGMTWEEIAWFYHYAYRWVMRLHKQALNTMKEEAQKWLDENLQT
jgi:DNA-directed RNA polymerase specialized sigma subunit